MFVKFDNAAIVYNFEALFGLLHAAHEIERTLHLLLLLCLCSNVDHQKICILLIVLFQDFEGLLSIDLSDAEELVHWVVS